MKFRSGDLVRVVAWSPPGVRVLTERHIVCGQTGVVNKIRENDNSDGKYQVILKSGAKWWFRPCDLVAMDSECICDLVVDHAPATECLVHDMPDPNPVTNTVTKLQALVEDLDDKEID